MNRDDKVKVLFFSANPRNKDHLDIRREIKEIKEKLQAGEYQDVLELIPCLAVRPGDLIQHLSDHKPHIVHFSGHGNKTNEIYLEDDDGNARPVPEAALEELFSVMKDNIQLVFLNACFAGTQAKVIARTVDAAIGMSVDIGDDAAIVFAAAFYRALGFAKSVQRAFDEARLELMLKGIPEENVPRLFTREGVEADGLFPVGSFAAEASKTNPAQASADTGTELVLWRDFSTKLTTQLDKGGHLMIWTSRYSGKAEFIRSFISFLNKKRRNWQVICLRPLTVPNITEADYFEHLLEQIHGFDEVSEEEKKPAGKSPSMQFHKALRRITRRPLDRVVVIFNSLGKSDPCHLQVVVSMLKALADEVNNEKFNLVFIGDEKLHSLCYYGISKNQSPLHIAKTVYLPDLSESETVSLVRRELPETETRSAVGIYRLTGGYYGLVRDSFEYFRECGGNLSLLISAIEKNAQFFSELRIALLNNPEYLDELSRWLEKLPEYYRDLSNMKNRQLFWLGLLKVEADSFSWRCETVRLIVEKIVAC